MSNFVWQYMELRVHGLLKDWGSGFYPGLKHVGCQKLGSIPCMIDKTSAFSG